MIRRVECLYAWIGTDAEGGEFLVYASATIGRRENVLMPLVSPNRDYAEQLAPLAQQAKRSQDYKRVALRTYTGVTVTHPLLGVSLDTIAKRASKRNEPED